MYAAGLRVAVVAACTALLVHKQVAARTVSYGWRGTCDGVVRLGRPAADPHLPKSSGGGTGDGRAQPRTRSMNTRGRSRGASGGRADARLTKPARPSRPLYNTLLVPSSLPRIHSLAASLREHPHRQNTSIAAPCRPRTTPSRTAATSPLQTTDCESFVCARCSAF